MKKKIRFLLILAALAYLASLSRKREFTADSSEENAVKIKASRAVKGDWAVSGSILIPEGGMALLDSEMTQGELAITFVPAQGADIDTPLSRLEEMFDGTQGFTVMAAGCGRQIAELPPDTYYVRFEAAQVATGTVTVSVQQA